MVNIEHLISFDKGFFVKEKKNILHLKAHCNMDIYRIRSKMKFVRKV